MNVYDLKKKNIYMNVYDLPNLPSSAIFAIRPKVTHGQKHVRQAYPTQTKSKKFNHYTILKIYLYMYKY